MEDIGPARDPGLRDRVAIAGLVTLAVVAAIYAFYPLWRATFPLEIEFNEAWNAYFADAVRSGHSPYPADSLLVANNYPPLSFYVIAALSALTTIDAIVIGRILSIVSILWCAGGIAASVRALGGGKVSSSIAALWFLATMARFNDVYVGMNDPHITALAITMTGMALFLRACNADGGRLRPASVAGPILIMVVAGFYKHTLIATPATLIAFAALRDRSAAVCAFAVGAAAATTGLALCVAIFGDAFVTQIFRAPRTLRGTPSLGEIQFIIVALLVWALWAWPNRRSDVAAFTAIFIGSAGAAFLLQRLGEGVSKNAQFELMAAAAIGLGVAFDRARQMPLANRLGSSGVRAAIVAAVIVRLLAHDSVTAYAAISSAPYRALYQDASAIMRNEIERVRAMPGAVACSYNTVCRSAGKPFVIEQFLVQQRMKTGQLDAQSLSQAVRDRGIRVVAIDDRVKTTNLTLSLIRTNPYFKF